MSKRVASDYITSEGSTPNPSASEATGKMSTAAQIASRKLAKPRGRTGASRPSQPSPFGGISSNQSPAQVSQQPQTTFPITNGGIAFGASQSFPPGVTTPGGTFDFQPPQSSSFTFGLNSSTPNPFANLNGNANPPPNSQSEDAMMESPQKKPSLGGFSATMGNGNTKNNTGGIPFSFGQAMQQQQTPTGGFTFGSTQNNDSQSSTGSGLFGQVAKTQQSASNNLFGQPAQSQPTFGGFGPSSSNPQTQAPNFNFGQAQSSQSTNGLFNFGQKTDAQSTGGIFASDPKSTNPSTSKPTFTFGQSQTSAPTTTSFGGFNQQKPEEPKQPSSMLSQSQPPSQPSSNVFGQPPGSGDQATAANPFASLFGQTTQTPAVTNPSTSTEASKPSFSFGQPSSSVSEPFKAPVSSGSESKQNASDVPTTSSSESGPKSLFSFPPKSSGSAPFSMSTSSNTFDFGGTSNDQSKSQAAAAPETTSELQKNIFNFSSSQTPSSGGLFSPAKSAAVGARSAGGILGQATKLNDQEQEQNETITSANKASTTNNVFGFKPTSGTPQAPSQTQASSSEAAKAPVFGTTNQFASLTQTPNAGFDKENNSASSIHKAQTSSFDTLNKPAASFGPSALSRPQNLFSATSEKPQVKSSEQSDSIPFSDTFKSPAVQNPSDQPNPKRQVYTQPAASIPTYLNGEGYKEYDTNYRLHSLNRELQNRIAVMDPVKHDFENIIRHYVSARESIGASIGLYTRNHAGTKRKNDDAEDRPDVPSQYKRSRSDAIEDVVPPKADSNMSTSSSTMSNPQAFASSNSVSMAADKASTSSKSTEMFRSMIPGSSNNASPVKPTSPIKQRENAFASLQSAPAAPQSNIFGHIGNLQSTGFASPAKTSKISEISQGSTTPAKSPPKKPVFAMPKFGNGEVINHMAAFAESAAKLEKKNREKRKAEDFDSDEDDIDTYNEKVEEEDRQKRAKIEAIPKVGFTPVFGDKTNQSSKSNFGSVAEPSKNSFGFGGFNASQSESNKETASVQKPTNIFSGFNSAPQKEAELSPADPVTLSNEEEDEEDGDEDHEDMHEIYEVEDDDEGGSDSSYQEGEEPEGSSEEEEAEDDLPEDEVIEEQGTDEEDDENDLQNAMNRSSANKGKSLFERIEPNPKLQNDQKSSGQKTKDPAKQVDASESGTPIMQSAKNSSFQPSIWGSHNGKSTPETPDFSPITPASNIPVSKESYKPAKTFSFSPNPQSSTPSFAGDRASIFSGGAVRPGPVPFDGIFGSRPSTPVNNEKSSNDSHAQLGNAGSPSDQTWKPGSAIKFGSPDRAREMPTLNVTAPSPSGKEDKTEAKGFSNLFGSKAPTTKLTEGSGTLGFSFGGPNSKLAPGFLGAASHLIGGSTTSSAMSSRATSPGLTDNESVATNETDDVATDPQTSLMDSRAGEEDEDCLWEARSKALKYISPQAAEGTKMKPNEWNTMGVGIFRVLKNKNTGKTRVILRAEPNATLVVNAHLMPRMTYETVDQGKSGALKGPLYQNGKLDKWVFKFKTKEMAVEVQDIIQKNQN